MTELLVVLFVTILVFGATRIPALGDALGRALRSARKEASGERSGGASDSGERRREG